MIKPLCKKNHNLCKIGFDYRKRFYVNSDDLWLYVLPKEKCKGRKFFSSDVVLFNFCPVCGRNLSEDKKTVIRHYDIEESESIEMDRAAGELD